MRKLLFLHLTVVAVSLSSAQNLQAQQTHNHKKHVVGAAYTYKDKSSDTISLNPNNIFASNSLGLVSPPNRSNKAGAGQAQSAFGFFKKVEIKIKISHSDSADQFQIYQGEKGTSNTNIPNQPASHSKWEADGLSAGTPEARDYIIPADWGTYPGPHSNVFTTSHGLQDKTLYLWDAPGFSTSVVTQIDNSQPPADVAPPPPAGANYYYLNQDWSYENVVKCNVGGVYLHVHNSGYIWHRGFKIVSTPKQAYSTGWQWAISGTGAGSNY